MHDFQFNEFCSNETVRKTSLSLESSLLKLVFLIAPETLSLSAECSVKVANCIVISIIKTVMFCEVLAEVRVEFEVPFENGSAGSTWFSTLSANAYAR